MRWEIPIFVVSSEDGDSLSILDFEDKDIQKSFYAVKASIDVIAHEKVIGILL